MAAIALGLVGCSNSSPANDIVASPQGVYFANWRGQVFKIEGDRLVPVTAKAATETPRVVKFQQVLPDSSRSGFPVLASGSLKAGQGMARVRLELTLGALGDRKPTAQDQSEFVERLRGGNEKLRSISLLLYDADGFLAAPHLSLGLSGEGWTAIVNERGVAELFQYNSRIDLAGVKEGEIASVDVQWFTAE